VDVYPSLTYRDVEAAIAFLERALGLAPEDIIRDEQGMVRSAILRCGSGSVLVQPDLPDELHGSHLGHGWVYVATADPDAHFERARAAGAEVVGEPHDAEETMRGYSARDLEGNLWSFGTDRPGSG
jgi:uncharacterized glyoxalase superfamily protein PhnB